MIIINNPILKWFAFRDKMFTLAHKLAISRRRGSVIDDIEFPIAILAYFFSRRHIVSKQRHCHTPNDLFDQIWRKAVPFGSLVQKILTLTIQPPEI